jgi:plastocyanin
MRRTGQWTVALAAIAILMTVAASCSSDDEGGDGGASGGDGGSSGDLTVTMKDIAFDPTTLTVTAGQDTTIQLVNEDGVEHSFTLDDDSASQDVEGGEDGSITINVSETIGWHCEYHPDTMKGTVEVA